MTPRSLLPSLALLLVVQLLHAVPLAAQAAPVPIEPADRGRDHLQDGAAGSVNVELPPAARLRLAASARDAALAPWQREFMLGLANGAPAVVERPARAVSTADAGHGRWFAHQPPSRRKGAASIYDALRQRMLVFGGEDISSPLRNEVWALSLSGVPAWSLLETLGTPPPGRYGHSLIYDPSGDRAILFGGQGAIGLLNDVWALTLGGTPEWTALSPANGPPSERFGHSAIYDPARDRMLVFGGTDYVVGQRNDVWALSLAGSPEWSFVAPGGTPPLARYAHAAVYDPPRDRMLVFGGYAGPFGNRNDVWALSLAGSPAWTPLAPSGTPPAARQGAGVFYDSAGDRMLVIAGSTDLGLVGDAWSLDLSGSPVWSALTPSGGPPAARFEHSMIHDAGGQRVIVFAGGTNSGFQNDVWGMSLSGAPAWTDLTPAGGPPAARRDAMAVYDPPRNRMLVFGGTPAGGNDLWALSLTGTPQWTQLAPTGDLPFPRGAGALFYDAPRDRVVLFGGSLGGSGFNDVWVLGLTDPPAWSELILAGGPPGRDMFAAVMDPVRERIVIFGGNAAGPLGDLWALSLTGGQWSLLPQGGIPPTPRFGHVGVYDPAGDRLIVHGGFDGGTRSDVWAYAFGTGAWTKLTPDGAVPPVRAYGTGVFDTQRNRMVVFGGYTDAGLASDAWALSLDATPAWTALAPAGIPPGPTYLHCAVYDPGGDRMVVFGGDNSLSYRSDTWFLDWSPPDNDAIVPFVADGSRLALAPPRPNPSRGAIWIEFELPRRAEVTLEVFDIMGRHAHRIAAGPYAAGRHAVEWPGDDEQGRALEPGVYLVRLRADGLQATRRIVRVR